jgi:hypothetical protein
MKIAFANLFFIFVNATLLANTCYSNEFKVRPIVESSQKYGYSDFCTYQKNVKNTNCDKYKSQKGYDELVGKNGVVLDEKIIQRGKYTYFPIQLENGSKFYLQTYKNKTKTPFKSSDIISIPRYNYVINNLDKPVREGSTLTITDVNLTYREGFTLSNNKTYSVEDYQLILDIISGLSGINNDIAFFDLLSDKKIEKDKFENRFKINTSLYMFKELNYRPTLSITTLIKGSTIQNLLKVQYSGRKWLFVDNYKIIANDEVYESGSKDFSRDNSSKAIWEWHTTAVEKPELDLLKRVVSDPNATIRFYGDDYYRDIVISEIERNEIKKALDLVELFSS